MFEQIVLSPQVKLCAIIIYKRSIYDLLHEFSRNLRFRTLGIFYPHGIFAAGGANVPTQEKKKKKI